MDTDIDALLAELTRLESTSGPSVVANDTPESMRKFSVSAASPFVPERVQIIARSGSDKPAPAIILPQLPTPRADVAIAKEDAEAMMSPLFVVREPALGASALRVPYDKQSGSRLLPQMPMAPPRAQLMPTSQRMVLDPRNLQYAHRLVDSGSSSAVVMEGFSEAMKKQSEYAKQNIGKQPHAPGGNALTEANNRVNPTLGATATTVSLDSEEEMERNRLVLEGILDEEALSRYVLKAPGMDDCLTVQDIRDAAHHAQREKQKQAEAATIGANPSHLLRPYMDIVSDQESLRVLQQSIAEEKSYQALEKTSVRETSGMVALDELLMDLEGDDELRDLGFHMGDDENEDDGDDQSSETQDSDSTEAPADADATALDPEAEVELLLREAAASKPQRKKQPQQSEWASLERVDVRNFHEKVPEMAMQYSFELDTFQKECVVHLERHECVFVAAHTSAGKTVVAEYAIAMSQKHLTRTIYTSPIKALSNQKYRDFRAKYGADNVGLITGDVSLNPDASCVVMTTEILRSMLYRGADVIRDIEWVIFDEIHYINDSERGVVWEEVIIMLPAHVGMVFLSATTPNHFEFSDWIGRTKQKKIHVISTHKRPVPLQHYLYAGKELFRLYDATSGYNANAYTAAKAKLNPPSDKVAKGSATGRAGGGGSASSRSMGRTSGGDQSDWTKLITSLKDKTLLPVVVFAFSKRLCEESASKLSKMDLSTPSERSEIHLFLEASIQRLHGSDRELPQVVTMKEMLKRGVGVHHGGLLPIIKEMVEILFGRGLVKVLFATETFAMGVNMPARTVVFNGIRKHDGKQFRDLLPGEYTQMAGRAGRRGLDTVGTVILACWSDVPEPTSLQTMLAGKATQLSSQFRLTYNMILNLLRVEVLSVEDMMKRSFSEFHTQKALAAKHVPQLLQRGKQLIASLEAALKEEYPHLESSGELAELQAFHALKRSKRELERRLVKWMLTNHAQAARAAIAPGRVVVVNVQGLPSDQLAVVVRTTATEASDASSSIGGARFAARVGFETGDGARATSLFKSVTILCLCPDGYTPPVKSDESKALRQDSSSSLFGARQLKSKRDDDSGGRMLLGRPMVGKRDGAVDPPASELPSNVADTILGKRYAVLDVPESCLDIVTATQASDSVNMKLLATAASKKELGALVDFLATLTRQVATSRHVGLPFVDVLGELKLNDLEVATAYAQWQQLYASVATHAYASDSLSRARVLDKVETIGKLQDYVGKLTRELSSDSLSLFPDFQQRLRVLKKLGYISNDGVVQVKGRVACEINTCDEIVLTEMIFENVLATLEPEEIVAVLSALIFQEKTQSEPTLTPRLASTRIVVQTIAESLGVIQLEQHLEIDPAVYCKGALNFGLMEVVYEWARGMAFKDLCQLTDIQEGSIVRCITRLDEVCREVRNAARVIGDPSLYRKMEVASEAIKRDVVFASSLYLA